MARDRRPHFRSRRAGTGRPPFNPDHFKYKPRFASLEIDDQGRLWALRWTGDGQPGAVDLFDGTGRFLTSVPVAEIITRLIVRGGRALGVGSSPEGEPILYVYEVTGGADAIR